MNCRACNNYSSQIVIRLGNMPPANNLFVQEDLINGSIQYPLSVWFCEACNLLQTVDYLNPEQLFTKEYVYLSSVSQSWVAHSKKFVSGIISELSLGKDSFIVEIASNDGYLLQEFQKLGISCLGIEPTQNTAALASKKGIKTVTEFFTSKLALSLLNKAPHQKPNLIIGNNVLAHVPNLNDFIEAVAIYLTEEGTAIFEFPHLLNLIKNNAFDTIYHEHFSYLSLLALNPLFLKWNLQIYKVEALPTHGGSLRIYVKHASNYKMKVQKSVKNILEQEIAFGLNKKDIYEKLELKAIQIKIDTLSFLLEKKKSGKKIIGYGAAAKGITFINYVGLNSFFIERIADSAKTKIGKFTPGSLIPIVSVDEVKKSQADCVIVFPWNLVTEIVPYIRKELPGVQIVTFLPTLKIW